MHSRATNYRTNGYIQGKKLQMAPNITMLGEKPAPDLTLHHEGCSADHISATRAIFPSVVCWV
jgi:hypothetical protein